MHCISTLRRPVGLLRRAIETGRHLHKSDCLCDMSVRKALVGMELRVQCYQRTREPGSIHSTEENAGASRIIFVQKKTVRTRTNAASRCHSLADCGFDGVRVRATSLQASAPTHRSVEAKDTSRGAVVLDRRTRHSRSGKREVRYLTVADGQGVQKITARNGRLVDIPDGEWRTLIGLASGGLALVNW